MNRPLVLLGAAGCLLALSAPGQEAGAKAADPAIDLTLLGDLEARAIGPAVCSGRIGAVAGVPGDPRIVWVGAASGGVWKSVDSGVTFEPVFDDQNCTSIGAIAIDPRSPEVVWIGTGEGNPRNSASVGRGVYRTRDGGRTWQHLGLARSEKIHRIVLDPRDPDVAFVAALGSSWADSEERGLYRTENGGESWVRTLHADERTGCSDIAIDPNNPDKMFATMWSHRRLPYSFASGGPGSGLHRSLDGGRTWVRLTDENGLPKGELGRICLALSPSDTNLIYALVEAKKSVLLKSSDGGFEFETVNKNDDIAPRPFYFCDIRVDPQDPNRLYNMHTTIDVSTDGGRTFSGLVGWGDAHPDHHAMWIDPTDPQRILLGNDGGVYTSRDRGHTWRFCRNLPLAQFYHVAVDDAEPFHVYGGLQDNGSWRGPSTVWENGGIRNLHWREVCFGDGFATLPMPDDARRGYAMSQGGNLVRWDLRTGGSKSIRPPAPDDVELRFNWNAAIAQDPFDADTIYYGSQFVHRSPDRGESWQVISPDLTTDDPAWQKQDESGGLSLDATGAENYCTILTIAPSPLERGLIWVGSDDGRVHVSRDGGGSWTSVEDRLRGLPRFTWCPHIEASKHAAGTAYAVFDGHRTFDWKPYVFVTEDYGATWRQIATADIDGYCLVLEEDPRDAGLLWLGTEFGLFVSFDGGGKWQRWKHGVPTCSAMAITTQPRTGDLVVATHGRGIYVLDELTPLRDVTPELLAKKLHLFPIAPAIAFETAQTPSTRFPGNDEFRGRTRPRGAFLDLIATADELKHPDAEIEKARQAARAEKPEEEPEEKESTEESKDDGDNGDKDDEDDDEKKNEVRIEIRDAAGALVRTFTREVHLGFNRIVWRLERDGLPGPSRSLEKDPKLPPPGREVLPGDYEVTVRFQGETQSSKVTVRPDPRIDAPMQDRTAKDVARARAEQLRADLRPSTQSLARCKRDLDFVKRRLELEPEVEKGAEDPHEALRKAMKAADKAHEDLLDRIWGDRDRQGIVDTSKTLMSRFMSQLRVSDTPDVPNASETMRLDRAARRLQAIVDAIAEFEQGPMAEFRTALQQSGLALLPSEGK
ncbi:MAG: hypothetical protein KDE27_25180 [Planctomycetes bacterium]|nr:hypothetical protein [Planctomycetota bacterium]